jgi:hypothetical protein
LAAAPAFLNNQHACGCLCYCSCVSGQRLSLLLLLLLLLQRSLTVITTGNAQLHLLQAGLAMHAHQDQEGARAAMARAQQQLGGLLDLYRLHLAQQGLKDMGKGAEGTASITTYVEFERSYK